MLYIYITMYVFVLCFHADVYAHIYICIWKPKHNVFLDNISHWTWSSSICLSQLANKHLPALGLQVYDKSFV